MTTKVKSYNENELLEMLRTYCDDMQVVMQDIKNPTQEFVNEMYRRILLEFNVDITSLVQPSFHQAEISSFEDMFQEVIPLINLMKAVKYFGILPDFGITDLVNPGPKRNLQQMSRFMQFLECCDLKISELNDKFEIIREMKTRKKKLIQGIDELKERKNDKALQRTNMKEEKLKLEKIYSQMVQDQKGVLNDKDTAKEKTQQVQNILNEKKHSVDRLEKQLDKIEEEIAKVKSQIVISPTSLVTDMVSLRKKKDEQHLMLENIQDKLQIQKQMKIQLIKEQNKQEERMSNLTELIELIHSTHTKKKAVESQKKILNKVATEIEEVDTTNKKILAKVECYNNEISDFQSQWNAEKTAFDENIESAKRDYREVESKNKEAESLQTNLEYMESRIQEETQEFYLLQEHFKNEKNYNEKEVLKETENIITSLNAEIDAEIEKLITNNQ